MLINESPVGVEVPDAISGWEVDRYVDILDLSDAQIGFVDFLYVDYLAKCASMERQEAPAILAAAAQVNPQTVSTAGFPEIFQRWSAAEDQFGGNVAALDDRLFAAIDSVLAEPQRPWMERVRLHRDRVRSNRNTGILMAHLDLSWLVQSAGLPIECGDATDALLWEYEQAVTPRLVRAGRVQRDQRLKLQGDITAIKMLTQRRARGEDTPAMHAEADAIHERMNAQYARLGEAQRDIAETNNAFIPRLIASLAASDGDTLRQAINVRVFPRAYPDATEVEALAQQFLASDALNDEQRAVLNEAWRANRRKYAAVCRRMEDSSRAWQEQLVYTGSSSGWRHYDQEIKELGLERVELNESFIEYALGLMPASAQAEFKPDVNQWRVRVQDARRQFEEQTPNGVDPR